MVVVFAIVVGSVSIIVEYGVDVVSNGIYSVVVGGAVWYECGCCGCGQLLYWRCWYLNNMHTIVSIIICMYTII